MNLGGIKEEGAERVFLISTTHGSEMSAFGAFIKTIDVYKKLDVTSHLWEYGKKFITGINSISQNLGIEKHFSAEGFACSPYYFTRDKEGNASLEFRTLFSQEMIKNGVLIPWVALSYSHGETELDLTLSAVEKSLKVYKAALTDGIEKHLVGRAIKPVFRKYN
jgi:glutamate-1-semialdehyde 2,1-aminomutase